MSILFWALISLSGPVFYIIGLVTFIRWLASRSVRPSVQTSDGSPAAQLRAVAANQPPDVARDLNRLADQLEHGVPRPAYAPATGGPFAPIRFEPGEPSGRPHTVPYAAPVPQPSTHWSSQNVGDLTASLDNINLLLYLGAFLIVVSAGIFVGYNFSVLSGTFKTIFLALF